MARKRGGLAGLWDRNKKILKPIATVGGFLAGGPAGAALVNGGISGLDRPGKRGVGFDVGAGARGALQGYAGGKVGQWLLPGSSGAGMGGLKNMFSGQAWGNVGDKLGSAAWEAGSGLSRVGKWAAADPKNLLALGQTAAGGLNAYGMAQQNNMMNQQTAMRQRESDERLRIRKLLMPYFEDYMASMGRGR
jgi:hypothetical protein